MSEFSDLETRFAAWFHNLELRLHLIHQNQVAGVATSSPPPLMPVVTQATPAQVDGVPPVSLDPALAVSMTQDAIENLGYVSFLNHLSQAERDQWVHDYLIAAQPTDASNAANVSHGALVYDPTTKTAVQILDSAQANLIQLHNLGAQIVTGSTPTQ